jgi:hypothetical protein
MQLRRLVITGLILVMTGVSPLRASQVVWSGLVIADNSPEPAAVPHELTKLEPTLKELFGYNQFQVIGQSRKSLKTGEEDWLATSKYFSLHVDARGDDGDSEGGYVLNLKLYQEQQMLLEWDTKLSKRSPLVVRGPQVGNGQLLLVLVVDEQEQNQGGESHKHQAHKEKPNKLISAWRYLSRKIRSVAP